MFFAEGVAPFRGLDGLANSEEVDSGYRIDFYVETIADQTQKVGFVPDFELNVRPECRPQYRFEFGPFRVFLCIDHQHQTADL